jgi:hypothetical protein
MRWRFLQFVSNLEQINAYFYWWGGVMQEGCATKDPFRVYHIDTNGFEQTLYFAIEKLVADILKLQTKKNLRNYSLRH